MHHRSFAWWLGVAFWAMTAWASAAQGLDRPEGKQAKAVSGPYGIISTVAGDGWGGFYGDGGVATKGECTIRWAWPWMRRAICISPTAAIT